MPARRGEAWNDEDITTLRRMAATRVSLSAIARALERNQEATCSQANRMNITLSHAASPPSGDDV